MQTILAQKNKIFSFILLIGAIYVLTGTPDTASASGTTYYISNVGCSNSYDGTETTHTTGTTGPWCDFANVNNQSFNPGDQILLERGSSWTASADGKMLILDGSGTSTDWIIVGAYGSGAAPLLDGDSDTLGPDVIGVYLENDSYVRIQDLQFSNMGYVIFSSYHSIGNVGLVIDNIYANNTAGIGGGWSNYFGTPKATSAPNSSQWLIRDITISNVDLIGGNSGIRIVQQLTSDSVYTTLPANSIKDVVIKNAYVHDSIGTSSLSPGQNVLVLDSRFDDVAKQFMPQGTTGYFLYKVKDFQFVNSMFTAVEDTGSYDMSAIDNEAYIEGSVFRGCYIANNAGSGLEWLSLSGRSGDYQLDSEVNGCSFKTNNTSGHTKYKSSLFYWKDKNITFTGTAANNFYSEPSGFLNNESNFSNWTLFNNLSIPDAYDLYHAGNDFSSMNNTGGGSCTPGSNCWSYQTFNGSSYSDLSYDSANEWWGISTGYVSRFNLLPNSSSSHWVARAWTAPETGTISIRSSVIKNDIDGGDGVQAKITKNGTTIWPNGGIPQTIAYNDRVGYDTHLDMISVTAGDIIRFEINNGGSGSNSNDLTSWLPSIAYYNSSVISVPNGDFERGDHTSWTTTGTVSIDSTNQYKGVHASKLGSSTTNGNISQTIHGLSSNTTYTLKAHIKAGSGRMYLRASGYGGSNVEEYTEHSSYYPVVATFTTGSSNTSVTITIWDSTAVVGSWGYVDEVTLTLSSVSVPNAGFESGNHSYWTTTGNVAIDSTNQRSGSYATKLGSSSTNGNISQTISGLIPDTTYTLQVYLKAGSGRMFMRASDFGGSNVDNYTESTSYTPVTVTFTTGSSSTSAIITIWDSTAVSGSWGYVDDITITQ